MELALSVGSEATKKREIWGGSVDRFRHGSPLTGNDIQEGGDGNSRKWPPIQLDLKLSWSSDDTGTNYYEGESRGGLDVNQAPGRKDRENDAGACSSEVDRASSRCSDEEEAGSTRKKLRLSKDQSCYLEESFKEHPTLNPKQKLALAKQLNLLPRQVEVWFQNRRARTKLKQTEVDCEYLKRCCESLTEENRRLHKELQDLKALKAPVNPFRMHVPATTLTMCPSCERVISSSSAPAPPVIDAATVAIPGGSSPSQAVNPNFGIHKSRFCPP